MQHPQSRPAEPDAQATKSVSPEFLTHCYRNAIERLQVSFDEGRPAAIVVGEGEAATRFVIGKFLSGLDEDTTVVRIADACTDAGELMGRLVRAVGFEPKDMCVADLESVLQMFLSFQKSHSRRTVICMEQIQDSEWWVLDKIRNLVDLEAEQKLGMMLIVSGQPGLKELLHTRPLSAVTLHAGPRISLLPFTLAETTEYIRRRVDGTTADSVDRAFHYQAISLIHELCAGVPDAISPLVSACLEIADTHGQQQVSTDLVKLAYEQQRPDTSKRDVDVEAATVNMNELQPRAGRLVVQLTGEDMRELSVRQGNILIGRGELCDICVRSTFVSRQHALISHSPGGGTTLTDLNSTNGTFVDGYRIKEHELVAGETITIGDCKIEYILEDDQQARLARAFSELRTQNRA